MPFCMYCGSQMNDGDIFCSNCGGKNNLTAQQAPSAPIPAAPVVPPVAPAPSVADATFTAVQQPPVQPAVPVSAPPVQAPVPAAPMYGSTPAAEQPTAPYGQQPYSPYEQAPVAAQPQQPVYQQPATPYAQPYGQQPSYAAGPYKAPTTSTKSNKTRNIVLFSIIGVLVVALIAVGALLFLGGSGDGGDLPSANTGTPVVPNTPNAPVTPEPVPTPPVSELSDAQMGLQAYLDAIVAADPYTMLGCIWELSDMSDSELSDFMNEDYNDEGYLSNAEQCGDWFDLLLANYTSSEVYYSIWVYDGLEDASILSFTMDNENPAEGEMVYVDATIEYTPTDSYSEIVELPFSMALEDGVWYVVYGDEQRAAPINAGDCVYNMFNALCNGNVWEALTYTAAYAQDYNAASEQEEALYAEHGDNPTLICSALLDSFLRDYGGMDAMNILDGGYNVIQSDYGHDFIINDITFSEDLSAYPSDAALEFVCEVDVTITTDYFETSADFHLSIPMMRDTTGGSDSYYIG